MQFEDFDKKIKEAAENRHPSYHENSWKKMESLLNTHMPVKENNRRRFLFLLLFFLLLGGGSTWLLVVNNKGKKNMSTTQAVTASRQDGRGDGPASLTKPVNSKDNNNNNNNNGTINPGTEPNTTGTIINDKSNGTGSAAVPANTSGTASTRTSKTANTPDELVMAISGAGKASRKTSPGKKPSPADQIKDQQGAGNVAANTSIVTQPATNPITPAVIGPPDKSINSTVATNNPVDDKAGSADSIKKAEDPAVKSTRNDKAKKKKTTNKGFLFSVSAGSDVSMVGFHNIGKLRPVLGAGIGYTYNRLTLRTGFYTASKIYTADPADYKPGYTIPNQNYLTHIDADCKVYEIPVLVSYQFNKPGKQNWFASAGISSYIMKKEKYDYFYKYPNGQVYSYPYLYENKNKHLFSVISISGGYNRKLNKVFSISAEPYLKIPVKGVGNGNVKLNSAGVLFSIQTKL